LTLAQSQITGLVTALGAKAGLTATQTLTGITTLLSPTSSRTAAIVKDGSTQSGDIFQVQAANGSVIMAVGNSNNQLFSNNIATSSIFHTSWAGPFFQFGSTSLLMNLRGAANNFVVRGAASQSANLQEWQNSAGTVLAQVNSTGIVFGAQIRTIQSSGLMTETSGGAGLTLLKSTSANGNPGAGFGRLYFRDGTNAGTLKLVVRAGAAGAETTILDNIPQ
jgi:hypothetical protein